MCVYIYIYMGKTPRSPTSPFSFQPSASAMTLSKADHSSDFILRNVAYDDGGRGRDFIVNAAGKKLKIEYVYEDDMGNCRREPTILAPRSCLNNSVYEYNKDGSVKLPSGNVRSESGWSYNKGYLNIDKGSALCLTDNMTASPEVSYRSHENHLGQREDPTWSARKTSYLIKPNNTKGGGVYVSNYQILNLIPQALAVAFKEMDQTEIHLYTLNKEVVEAHSILTTLIRAYNPEALPGDLNTLADQRVVEVGRKFFKKLRAAAEASKKRGKHMVGERNRGADVKPARYEGEDYVDEDDDDEVDSPPPTKRKA